MIQAIPYLLLASGILLGVGITICVKWYRINHQNKDILWGPSKPSDNWWESDRPIQYVAAPILVMGLVILGVINDVLRANPPFD